MAEEKEDRRTRWTQQALIRALLELIETKAYDSITVQDIILRADVGRSTFYAHYQNKDDLLMSGFEHLLDLLVQEIVMSDRNQLVFDTSMLFRHAHGHYEIYRKLIWGPGFKLLTKDGHTALSQRIEKRLSLLLSTRHPPSIPLPVLACTVSGILLVLLKWWLDKKMPYPPERMDEIFQQLVIEGLRTALG